MRILRDWTIGNRVALAVVAASTLGAGAALLGVRRATPAAERAAVERVSLPALAPPAVAGDSLERLVDVVVDVDPFQPGRRRPAVRFRTRAASGADAAGGLAVSSSMPGTIPAPTMTLQGIAHLPDGNALAVVSVRGGAAQILRLGQSLDQLRLTRVDSTAATLVGPDTTVILHLPGTTSRTKP